MMQPYTVKPTLLVLDFGVLGHLCQNDVIMSWLRLTASFSFSTFQHMASDDDVVECAA